MSQGSGGSALKLVSLVEIPDYKGIFNIAIVDVDADTGVSYSDERYTGNHGALKVFTTVATIVEGFSLNHQVGGFILKGSETKRKRVYVLLILRYLTEIGSKFEV